MSFPMRQWGKPKGGRWNTDGQMSDSHGQGQVAQDARWPVTLKASGACASWTAGEWQKAAESNPISRQIIDAGQSSSSIITVIPSVKS